jgi:hypothetical protein
MLTDGQLESGQNILKKEIGAALRSNDLTELTPMACDRRT